jgi:hypothetical protein
VGSGLAVVAWLGCWLTVASGEGVVSGEGQGAGEEGCGGGGFVCGGGGGVKEAFSCLSSPR